MFGASRCSGRSVLFSIKEESRLATSSSFSKRPERKGAFSGGTYVATHPSRAHEDTCRVCRPCSVLKNANPRASGSVATIRAGRRTDSARRASGDDTASSPNSWRLFPYVHERIASLVNKKQLIGPCPFGRSYGSFLRFFAKKRRDTVREIVGPESHRDPETWCPRTGTLQAKPPEAWCSRTGTSQAKIPSTASYGLEGSAFDLSLKYSTDNVVLFWHPPSYSSQCSPSSFIVAGVSYSCTEQFMIAEKARLLKDHRAVDLIMSLPD